ncbi:MAG: carboxypeptidase regulatory-like domain-containing protein [Chitinophagaceae bacterium]|nr:carboxypeptidase regulatory-like domain-containing protein [Chitinophagaceae bacterium]
MSKPIYNCAQQDLFTIATMGWKSCEKRINQFEAFKAHYTAAFIADKKAQLKAAEHMPSEQERDGKTTSLRMHLSEANETCLRNFKHLKRYIDSAFPGQYAIPEYNTIGQEFYEKALRSNWEATRSILTKCSNYITNNLVKLTDNLNMPATFPAKFEADALDFQNKHEAFIESEEVSVDQTAEKIDAINAVYQDLMSMFADAQEIFYNQPAILKEFTFSQVLFLVSGAGTAGVRGIITNTANNKAVKEATITINETEASTVSDDVGKYEISPMASGTYTILVSAPGFESQSITHEVLIGTISTLNINLTPSAVTV